VQRPAQRFRHGLRGRGLDGQRRAGSRRARKHLRRHRQRTYNPQFGLDQLGESVVRLSWNPGNPGSLITSDWFTPFRDVDRDGSHKDQDLASGGVIVLPDEGGLIVGGKDGVYYHVSRSDLGHRDL
jgi:hypothetical protein